MVSVSKILKRSNRRIIGLFYLLLCLSSAAFTQDLPDKIRGYKVYKENVSVRSRSDKTSQPGKTIQTGEPETLVKIGDPQLKEISLTGIILEIPAEISPLPESGKVDFLTFNNFRINDLPVDIEDYKESFNFTRNQPLKLAEPLKIFLSTPQALRGAWQEFKESKTEWLVTGRVFVFGRFKKFGLTFKRVVPVEISLKIKNPLH